ncbi:polysaccharide biosynthesis tyrosine autokinase [Aestuariimicrobium ganziense]|uniref:polysaccharide biosynthesis tyrosine autokinase n=1 Tax=Aestuariimicrobium ganziense TaxID=2773677 RepID=UPI0019408848|nr:polysaccharide biosynthesis tyrosine autokinase [Aestuariimicrobium ganziense]
MTLLDFVRLTRHNVVIILSLALIGGALGAAYALTRPSLYQATTLGVVVVGSGDQYVSSTAAQEKAAAYVSLMDTTAVWARIGKDPAVVSQAGAAQGSARASVVGSTNMIRIVASAPTPEGSVTLANAAMRALSAEAFRLESLSPSKDGLKEDPNRVTVQIAPYQQASGAGRLDTSNLPIAVGAGLLGGLLLGYLIAFTRKQLDVRVRTTKDVEELTGHSVLAVVPDTKELGQQRTAKGESQSLALGPAGEALRQLRTNLRYVNVDDPPRSIVITSANPGEGKSTISSNLARLMARSGQNVVLIDADLRKPVQHKIFGLDNVVGLTQVLAGSIDLEDALNPTPDARLLVLPSGRVPPNPSEVVGSQRMRELIETLSEDSFVIVDAPPVLAVTDPGLVAAACDGVILVSRVGKTYKEQMRLSMKLMSQVGATMFGTVLHRAPRKALGSVVYGAGVSGKYHSYYGNYYGDKKSQGAAEVIAPDPDTENVDEAPRRAHA